MDFRELSNPWSEYELPDGRKVRVRHILTDVTQTGIDADGHAQYHLNFGVMVHIEPTEKQKAAVIEQSNKAQEAAGNNTPKGTLQ